MAPSTIKKIHTLNQKRSQLTRSSSHNHRRFYPIRSDQITTTTTTTTTTTSYKYRNMMKPTQAVRPMSIFQGILLLSAYTSTQVCAFSPSYTQSTARTFDVSTTSTATSLTAAKGSDDAGSSRRDVLESLVSFGIVLPVMSTAFPSSAAADEPRPMYLTEPTDEFKANEAKAMEFKRQQLQIKKEFSTVLEKLLAEPNDEGALVSDLKALKALIAKTGGLPLGIKKDELYKVIRSKKAKGFWPTNVEIAYQSLQQEISYQQNPNLEKDVGNPYQ